MNDRGRLAVLVIAAGLCAGVGCGNEAAENEAVDKAEHETVDGSLVARARLDVSGGSSPGGAAGWRQCEFEQGPLNCGPGRACDLYRNRCVEICEGDNCCDGVRCPSPSVCVSLLGRCGTEAGPGCFDMGTTWWTGRDVPRDAPQSVESPTPVRFDLHNDGVSPLYFESTMDQQLIGFDLYAQYRDRERKLELAENHFCPSHCPERGPAREVDCGRPPRFAQRVPAGETVSFSWSGAEEIWNLRVCDRPQGQYCQVTRVTLPGTYTVEVCAHTDIEGGEPTAEGRNRLVTATLSGERHCRRVEFKHPTSSPVDLRFGE